MCPRTRNQSRSRSGRISRRTPTPSPADYNRPLRRSARIAARNERNARAEARIEPELEIAHEVIRQVRRTRAQERRRARTMNSTNSRSRGFRMVAPRHIHIRRHHHPHGVTNDLHVSNEFAPYNGTFRALGINVNVERNRDSSDSDESLDVIVVEAGNNTNIRRNVRENMLHFGNLVGMFFNNNYSSDSEDSFIPPRVIDPNEISEDESDGEVNNIVELPLPNASTPVPRTVRFDLSNRAVTRSMSRNSESYNQQGSSRRTVPYPSTSKHTAVPNNVQKQVEANSPGTKTVIKVDKMNPCTICFEDAPKRPVACTCCRQTIGCRYCVKKWFFTTNMSHLDQRTPYPIGTTDRNHKRCPLCRAYWGDKMMVVAAIERDSFPALIQATNQPSTAQEELSTKS